MSAYRIALFVVFMLVGLGGLNLLVFHWLKRAFRFGPRTSRVLKTILVAAVLGMVLGRVAGKLFLAGFFKQVVAAAATLELSIIISGVLLLVPSMGLGLLRLSGWLRGRAGQGDNPAPAEMVTTAPESPRALAESAPATRESAAAEKGSTTTRRELLAQAVVGSAFLIGGGSSLYGALKGRHDYAIEEVPFKLPGLPRGFDGFVISQLSDMHIGLFTGEPELRIAEELLRKSKPDLIVLTGDLLDNDVALAPELGRFVRRLLPLARHGVVAITGNHDYYAGAETIVSTVNAAGARMLRNQGLLIGGADAGFALLGVEDVWSERLGVGPNLERAVQSLRALDTSSTKTLDLPRVLLCHNPSYFAEAAGHVALQLSGHTHGGQVNLGFRPADWLLPGGWVAGRYQRAGSELYVNRGFGTVGPPARVGAPPEVTRIVLTA